MQLLLCMQRSCTVQWSQCGRGAAVATPIQAKQLVRMVQRVTQSLACNSSKQKRPQSVLSTAWGRLRNCIASVGGKSSAVEPAGYCCCMRCGELYGFCTGQSAPPAADESAEDNELMLNSLL